MRFTETPVAGAFVVGIEPRADERGFFARAYAAEEMESTAAGRVREHTDACDACRDRLGELRRFVDDLNTDWTRERLRSMGAAHPSTTELEALWMDDASQHDLDAVRRHVEECEMCRTHLARLKEGLAALTAADPLNRPAWSDLVRHRFAAGIEMVVEAATGAYTSAAGMVRDVMTPQARVQMAPAQSFAMGGARTSTGLDWHDASFLTDDLSGEVTGSTDPNTGRGIITVAINKSGAYVASPPIVDLLDEQGGVVSTQFALDMGDRYTAHFDGLDEGRYLVGIREPGD